MSIRKDQNPDNTKHVDEQKALERTETIAKLARKLKYVTISKWSSATTARIGEGA
jgi:hypothetical protein